MQIRVAILCFAFLPAVVPPMLAAQDRASADVAETDPHQAQIQAATTHAVAALRDQILQMSLGGKLRVDDFLKQTQGADDLAKVLQSAQPVGGPRWVDDNTCQIRVELPASKISAMLGSIASDPGRHSPLSASAVKVRLDNWKRLKFCAAGSSAGGQAIELARPADASGKWSSITETIRKSAVARAHADAVTQLLSQLNPIVLTGETHAKDALADPAISAHLSAWLDRQPVTQIEFLDDLNVKVTIAIAPRSLAGALKAAVQHDPAFARALPIDWDHVTAAMSALPASVTGTASVVPATTLPNTILPVQPPDWIDQNLQADATATGAGSRLKIGHAAEARAVASIREQLLSLHIDPRTTLGDAAKTDPQLNQAIDRSLLQAHAARVEYLADGSVKVHVSLDLREAWDELRGGP